jgi:hypothetical protein
MKILFQIMVPTIYGDTEKPISTRHHKQWDAYVRGITGGLTIAGVSKGQWIDPKTGALWIERIIPVQIACTQSEMDKIVNFSLIHYRQKAIMYCVLSNEVRIVEATEP